MDVEARLVLYTVVFGAGAGLALLLRRRVRGFLGYRLELAALLAVSLAGLTSREAARLLAWPSFWAFVAVAIVPSGLIHVARRASRARRFGIASASASSASFLLGLPAPFRREAALYAAMRAVDRGDDAACGRRLERMQRSVGIPAELGGEGLVRMLPAAARRRWDEVLDALSSMPFRPPALLGIEVRAAADTGDLTRALRACRAIESFGPDFASARTASRRCVLAAAGRTAFLSEAARRRLHLMSGPAGTSELALARAHEAVGDVATASRHYAAALGVVSGGQRLDAEAGVRRCAEGRPLVTSGSGLDDVELLALEEACRIESPPPDEVPLRRRAPFTVGISAITAVVSLIVIHALGIDGISLLSAGALSAPFIREDGEWWRLGSTMLLHGGWFHLLMNLGAILFVGVPLETRFGPARTAIVYVGSGLVASMASAFLADTEIGVGASGAAMGLVGAFGVLLLRRPHLLPDAERRRWLYALGLTVVATLAIGIQESDSIDNTAHAAGLLAGALIALALLPRRDESGAAILVRRLAGCAAVGLMAVCVTCAAREFRRWRDERVVEFRGGRVVLPSWLRLTPLPDGGLLATRAPLGFAVELGASPAEPHPSLVVGDDPDGRRLLLEPPTSETDETLPSGVASRTEDRVRPEKIGLRLRTFRAGPAFALVSIPLSPDGETEGDDAAVQIGRSLSQVGE